MILFCWEIKLKRLKKKKSARERNYCRGIKAEDEEKRKRVTEQLKREFGV